MIARREEEHDVEWTSTSSRLYPFLRGVGRVLGSLLSICRVDTRLPLLAAHNHQPGRDQQHCRSHAHIFLYPPLNPPEGRRGFVFHFNW